MAVAGLHTPGARASQGMAAPGRTARPSAKIQTNLPPITVDFRDVALEAGLKAQNVSCNDASKKYIVETTGTGVALLDYDNDGLLDVFVVNATRLDGGDKSTSHLYRNRGNLRFEDVTEKARLSYTGWGQGVC